MKAYTAIITLDRPERRNAITLGMLQNFPNVIDEVSKNLEAKVLVITGAGRGFCSGFDVGSQSTFARKGEDRNPPFELMGSLVLPVVKLGKPTIAAINGAAAGIGVSLAAICDIRIASRNARFISAWAKVGLIPDEGGTYLLPRLIGMARALEFMYLGSSMDVMEAERVGLVNRVVAPEELMPAAIELGDEIAKGPPIALRLMKEAVYRNFIRELEEQIDFERHAQTICNASDDHREGVAAFLEKREPLFRGRSRLPSEGVESDNS